MLLGRKTPKYHYQKDPVDDKSATIKKKDVAWIAYSLEYAFGMMYSRIMSPIVGNIYLPPTEAPSRCNTINNSCQYK